MQVSGEAAHSVRASECVRRLFAHVSHMHMLWLLSVAVFSDICYISYIEYILIVCWIECSWQMFAIFIIRLHLINCHYPIWYLDDMFVGSTMNCLHVICIDLSSLR